MEDLDGVRWFDHRWEEESYAFQARQCWTTSKVFTRPYAQLASITQTPRSSCLWIQCSIREILRNATVVFDVPIHKSLLAFPVLPSLDMHTSAIDAYYPCHLMSEPRTATASLCRWTGVTASGVLLVQAFMRLHRFRPRAEITDALAPTERQCGLHVLMQFEA